MKSNFSQRLFSQLAFVGAWSLIFVAGGSFAANFPLEIVQPRPDLDVQNRFYKAYPNLEYNVRLAVTGGDYPYTFSLEVGPPGMTIDSRGEVTWDDPSPSNSPYEISVEVTDRSGTTESITWPLTVTTSGFIFVDARNGTSAANGGTGTIDNPYRTMADVYGGTDYDAKWEEHLPGYFVYWRNGTYSLDAYKEGCPDTCRIPWSGRKPLVWLAFPNEDPVINNNLNGHDAFIQFYDDVSDLYIDGFDFNANGNNRGMALAVGGYGNMVIRRNIFHGVTNSHAATNNSLLFLTGGSGQHNVIQDNVGYDSIDYWLLGYGAPRTLVEDNRVYDVLKAISPKDGNRNWFIRGNSIEIENRGNARGIFVQGYTSNGLTGDIEISYNLVEVSGSNSSSLHLNNERSGSIGAIHSLRNTHIGDVEVVRPTSSNGPFTFQSDVIINNASASDGVILTEVENASSVSVSSVLHGDVAAGIVDSRGRLTVEYAEYLGSRGFQLGPVGPMPMPPTLIEE